MLSSMNFLSQYGDNDAVISQGVEVEGPRTTRVLERLQGLLERGSHRRVVYRLLIENGERFGQGEAHVRGRSQTKLAIKQRRRAGKCPPSLLARCRQGSGN